jgi:hypothetical protein
MGQGESAGTAPYLAVELREEPNLVEYVVALLLPLLTLGLYSLPPGVTRLHGEMHGSLNYAVTLDESYERSSWTILAVIMNVFL